MQTALIIIDEDASGDVHSIDQAETLFYPALAKTTIDLCRDINEASPCRHLKPQFLTIKFNNKITLIGMEKFCD